MSRKKPQLAPLTVSQGGANSSFSLSDTGSFAQDNVVLSSNGMQSPLSGGEVSGLRLDDLEPGALIGRGASSRVYCAVHRPTGKPLALKVLQEDIESNRESRHMVLNEIKTVFGAGSDHLVTFYDAFLHNGAVYLALEYMDCGSLEALLRVASATEPGGALPEGVLAAILFQSLQGLIYLHRERRSVHRDLKPANILLDCRGFVKLSDFGITKELGSGTYAQAGTHVGTLAYMSPERVRGESYDFSSDVWSLGLIALEAALGYYPYAGAKNVFDIGQMIAAGPLPTERPEVQAALPADLLELVSACLCREPQRRPHVSQLMQFPFLNRHLAAPIDIGAYMRAMQPSLQQYAHAVVPPTPAGGGGLGGFRAGDVGAAPSDVGAGGGGLDGYHSNYPPVTPVVNSMEM